MNQNEELEDNRPKRVFALITDNEVFHKWYIDEDYENDYIAALIYGLQSGPKVVDITDLNHEDIDFGWIQNGEHSFVPPNHGG